MGLFFAKIRVIEDTGCWEWTGYLEKGYGRFRSDDGIVWAHRYSYELMVGSIPHGFHIDHLCRNPGCVNPGHLEAVTPLENTMRGLTPVRKIGVTITHCPSGHEYTPDNLTKDRTRVRCAICTRIKVKEYQRSHPEMRRRQRRAYKIRRRAREKALRQTDLAGI